MKVVSLDQSIRSTGVTLFNDGEYSFKIIGAPKEIRGTLEQLKFILKSLQEFILREQPDAVLVEGLPYGLNSTSVRPLAALYYHLLLFCDYWGLPCKVIPITTAKKAAGKGNMKKSEMYEVLPDDIKKMINDTARIRKVRLDLSDSYWILQAYLKDILWNQL